MTNVIKLNIPRKEPERFDHDLAAAQINALTEIAGMHLEHALLALREREILKQLTYDYATGEKN